MQKSDSFDGPYYLCPICGKTIHYVVHPSMGGAWSRGRVRGEHLRSHNIDHHFISPERKDDPLFIKTLFKWNQKLAKGNKKARGPAHLNPFAHNKSHWEKRARERQMLNCGSKEENVRVLFCCTHNRTRSRTGEHLLTLVDGYDVKSAGLCIGRSTHQDGRVKVTQEHVNWADLVFVMEYWMKEYMLLKFRVKTAKIRVLGIRDGYFYGEPELVRKIAERLGGHGIDVGDAIDRFESRSFDREPNQ